MAEPTGPGVKRGASVWEVHRAWADLKDGQSFTVISDLGLFTEYVERLLDDTTDDLSVYLYSPITDGGMGPFADLCEVVQVHGGVETKCSARGATYAHAGRTVELRHRNVLRNSERPGDTCGSIRGDAPNVILGACTPSTRAHRCVTNLIIPLQCSTFRTCATSSGATFWSRPCRSRTDRSWCSTAPHSTRGSPPSRG